MPYLTAVHSRIEYSRYMHAAESYSRTEELAHAFTAAVGVAAMLLGIPWLVLRAAENGGAWRVIGALAFGCGGLMMFATSTLYHAARRPGAKTVLRRWDHSAIFLLIAGTYTPFTVGVIRGPLGWSLFGIVWALAILGVIAKLSGGMLRIPKLSTLLYVLIGWIGVVACRQLWHNLTATQFGWMVAGGLCYTGGVPFYLWKRKPYAHVVWHLFVLGGVACHFVAIFSLISTQSAHGGEAAAGGQLPTSSLPIAHAQKNACRPVCARPRMSACTSCVPS